MQHEHFLLVLLFGSAFLLGNGVNSNCNHNAAKGPIVAALLDLHSDSQCSVVSLKGLQQLAALEASLKQINSEFRQQGIEILLQVFDTCLSKKVAVTATLKALVSSKQTCLHTPLFLGFIGPEIDPLLKSVQNLTRIFNAAHVLPYNLNREDALQSDKNLYLTSYPTERQTQASQLLIQKLGWKSVSILFEEADTTRLQAESLVTAIGDNETLCINGNVIMFNDEDSLKEAVDKKIESDGIIIFLDDIEWSYSLFKHLEALPSQIILFLGNVGLPSWAIPPSKNNQTIFLIQQVSATPVPDLTKSYDAYLMKIKSDQQNVLCKERMNSKCGSDEQTATDLLEMEQDWSVNLMQYALMLYSSTLRIAHHIKCKSQGQKESICPALSNIAPKEWNDLLSRAAVFIKPAESTATNKKVTFQMEVVPRFVVYTNHRVDRLEKKLLFQVGWIANDSLITQPGYEFPGVAGGSRGSQTCGHRVVKVPEPAKVEETVIVVNNSDESDDFFYMDYDFYEMIGIIGGLAFGALLTMLTVICLVYRSFRVKSRSSLGNSSSENSSMSPRGSIDSR